jgi:hypothetical protein
MGRSNGSIKKEKREGRMGTLQRVNKLVFYETMHKKSSLSLSNTKNNNDCVFNINIIIIIVLPTY